MWPRRSGARRFMEVVGREPGSRGEVGAETARLLGAADLLMAAAGTTAVPDVGFAASLRADLLSKYDELVSAREKPDRSPRARRAVWFALPAAAAAVAVILALVFLVFKPAGPAPVADLTVQAGRARVVDPDGRASLVSKEADIHLDDRVITPGGTRATITFRNGNIVRLEAYSEVRIDNYDKTVVTLAQQGGKTYNRVSRGTSYTVLARRVAEVRAVGTAFGVDLADSGVSVPVFEGTVKARPRGGAWSTVDQGSIARITGEPGAPSISVEPLDLSSLDFSWLAFNRDLDRKAGFPLGVLEGLAPSPSQGNIPPGSPDSSTPGDQQYSQPGQTGSQPDQTATQPGQQSQPLSQPSASLALVEGGPPVHVSWSSANTGSAQSVAVLRADGQATPVYPANVLSTVSVSASASYRDGQAVAGNTYTYRVAFIAGGKLLVYSNPLFVMVPATAPPPPPPPPSLSLSGEMLGDGMHLSWSIEGSATVDSWAILASDTSSSPSYPGSAISQVSYSGPGGSYIVYKANPYTIHYYRVAALSGGSVVVYSNVVRNVPAVK